MSLYIKMAYAEVYRDDKHISEALIRLEEYHQRHLIPFELYKKLKAYLEDLKK